MRSPKSCLRIAALLVLIAAESALPSRAQTAGPSHVYENLGTVLPRTGIPSTAIWRQGNLLYGEAVDPDTDKGPFVVYDLNKRKVLYSGNEDIHTGFRCIMVDNEGNAYFSVNTTGLGKYDPRANSVTVLNVTLSASLRASTRQASDGWIYDYNRDGRLDEATLPVNATAIRMSAGEFATLPVTAPGRASQELHFAQFADGEGVSSTLLVVNPSADTEARGTANLFRADGLPLVVDVNGSLRTGNFDFNIPPLGTGFFATDGLGALVSGSARVTSNAPVGGSILFGGTIGVAGVGGVGPLKKFLAPIESDLARRIQTGVALSNPGEMQVQVSVQLRDENGEAVPNGNLLLTLPPHGQLARFADEIFKEKGIDLSQLRGTLEVDGPTPIAGMAIRVNPGQFATFPVAPVQP